MREFTYGDSMAAHADGERITADALKLMKDGASTASFFLERAIEDIDEKFGEEGFAKKNPGLLSAYMQTAVADCGAAIMAQQIRNGLEKIATQTEAVAEEAHAVAEAIRDGAKAIRDGAMSISDSLFVWRAE